MILYEVTAWKEEDECNFSPCTTYREAVELGQKYYPSGYDIEAIDTDEMD